MIAWIPKTQNLYDDNLEYLSSFPISFSNFGLKKIKSIACNSDVCHAITEGGSIFSWGNDIDQKGLLALGDNIFQVKIPTFNKYLSSLKIVSISLSETHGAAIDYNKNLFTWGDDFFGQCGYNNNYNNKNSNNNNNCNNCDYNDDNNNFVCYFPKKVVLNSNFHVNKVQCGKYYTAGISTEGIAFKFGLINYKNQFNVENIKGKKSNIVFFNYKNNNNDNFISHFSDVNLNKVVDIFCGEELLSFVNLKGELFIYSEIQGLFKIQLNNEKDNTQISLINEQKQNYSIETVKFIDRTFYAISKSNSIIFEFINYTYNNKDFNVYDYVQNEYDINQNVKLSMIKQPYYVKVIFFQLKCTDDIIKSFEEYEDKLFNKRKYKTNKNSNYKNDYSMNNNTFGNFTSTYESLKTFNNTNNNISGISKISRISNMLGNLLERKIEHFVNKTRISYNSEGNAFLTGKKRIELIKIEFDNLEGVNFLENEPISEIFNSLSNTFNMSSNILNIPFNENYINDRSRRKNIFEEERNKSNSNSKFNTPNNNNFRYNIYDSNNNSYYNTEKKENYQSNNNKSNIFNNQKFKEFSSDNLINRNNNNLENLDNEDEQIEKLKQKMNKLRKNVVDDFEKRVTDSNKNSEKLKKNLNSIEINDDKNDNYNKKCNALLDKFKNEIEKQKEENKKNKILREEIDKRSKEISNLVNKNKNNIYDNSINNTKRNSIQEFNNNNSKRNSINIKTNNDNNNDIQLNKDDFIDKRNNNFIDNINNKISQFNLENKTNENKNVKNNDNNNELIEENKSNDKLRGIKKNNFYKDEKNYTQDNNNILNKTKRN